MSTQIQLRRDSTADWTSNNPILAEGEIGYDTDLAILKVGDGSTTWSGLGQFTTSSGLLNVVEDTTPQLGGNLDLGGYNVGTATATEVGYLSGATSTIQTQLDDMISSSEMTTISGDILTYVSDNYVDDTEMATISGDLQTNIDGKDNYSSWSFAVDGVTKDAITSGDIFNIVGGDNITVTRSAEDTITISGGAGGGASTFVGLTDTPNDYTAAASKFVKVNVGGDALEFVASSATWSGGQVSEDIDLNGNDLELTPAAGGEDHSSSGFKSTVTVDVNATGIGAALYLATDGHYEEACASGINTMLCTALALEAGTGSKKVLHYGYMRDDTWNWTPGLPLYVSDVTAGALTQDITTASGSGEIVQVVGEATHADRVFFNPQLSWGEV